MKTVIITTKQKIKIKGCIDCPYEGGRGWGGWYGNESAGGYSFFCKKKHNKTVAESEYQKREDWCKASKIVEEKRATSPDWCPL